MPSEFDLQAILSRTKEEIQADNTEQEKNRLRISARVPNSEEKSLYLHSLGTERDARANIDSIIGGLQERRTPEQNDILQAALRIYQSKLAESFFWQGRFEEATHYETRIEQLAEYHDYAEAIINIDAGVCDCAPIKRAGGNSAKGVSTDSRRVVQTVFVESLDKSVNFIRCESCKSLFAVVK